MGPGAAARAGTSPFLSGEEEEELLSTLSPSSYIQRLHRELEGSGSNTPRQPSAGQYQFNMGRAAPSAPSRRNNRTTVASMPVAAAPSVALSNSVDPFQLFSPPTDSHFNSNHHGAAAVARSHQRMRNNNSASRGNAGARPAPNMEDVLEIGSSDDDSDDVREVIDVDALS